MQCNNGYRNRLTIAGIPVGQEIPDLMPCFALPNQSSTVRDYGPCGSARSELPVTGRGHELGSIIIVIATDAPLLPTQLKRLAKRAALALGRTGGTGGIPRGTSSSPFRPPILEPQQRIAASGRWQCGQTAGSTHYSKR